MDILDLSGLVVVGQRIDNNSKTYFIEAESVEAPCDCAQCGTAGNPIKSGTRKHSYRDLPIRGNRVIISLKVQRFKCRTCGATIVHRVPGMDTVHSMTVRCVEWIGKQSLRDTFVRVARDIGCGEKTVRNIANDYIGKKNQEYKPYMPEVLGITETSLAGRHCCVLADIVHRKPVDLLMTAKSRLWVDGFTSSAKPPALASSPSTCAARFEIRSMLSFPKSRWLWTSSMSLDWPTPR